MRLLLCLAIGGGVVTALDLVLDLEPFGDWAITGAALAILLLAARLSGESASGGGPTNAAKT